MASVDGLRADDIIDRQRLRRRLTFWRIVAVLAVLAIIGGLTLRFGGDQIGAKSRDHVARIDIAGTLLEDDRIVGMIDTIAANDRVRGVIVTIDSPGGTTAAGEAIHEALLRLGEDKPVVAQVDTLAASAGYMIAAGADHIVARQTSIVGSIGVIVQYPNLTGLLEDWGIEVRGIRSTPLKAEPDFFGPPPPGAEQMIREMVLDSYDWFKDLVAERRGFDQPTIDRLADGSVFTGRQALELGLVDELGGRKTARDWLTEQGVGEGLTIIDWRPRSDTPDLLGLAAIGRSVGLIEAAAPIAEAVRDRVLLDGLISLWHADVAF